MPPVTLVVMQFYVKFTFIKPVNQKKPAYLQQDSGAVKQ